MAEKAEIVKGKRSLSRWIEDLYTGEKRGTTAPVISTALMTAGTFLTGAGIPAAIGYGLGAGLLKYAWKGKWLKGHVTQGGENRESAPAMVSPEEKWDNLLHGLHGERAVSTNLALGATGGLLAGAGPYGIAGGAIAGGLYGLVFHKRWLPTRRIKPY